MGRKNTKQNILTKDTKSTNHYYQLLVKLYRYMYFRTRSRTNGLILRYLLRTRKNRRSVSLSKIVKIKQNLNDKKGINTDENIFCVVSTVTNDERLMDIPSLTICALKVTESARSRIEENGGKVLTFEQLALASPDGNGVLLIQGRNKSIVTKQYGIPGSKIDKSRPKMLASQRRSNNFQRGRGRRTSKHFKI